MTEEEFNQWDQERGIKEKYSKYLDKKYKGLSISDVVYELAWEIFKLNLKVDLQKETKGEET